MTASRGPIAIEVIDSHTAGEPTRLVIEGGPDLGTGPLADRLERFREHFDRYRSAIVNEPRGSEALVGALLCTPHRADCDFGVIFFNNVGFLGMCGHGTIGLIASLAHAGRCTPGSFRIDTPVGLVNARLHADGRIDVENVTSYRKARQVRVPVGGVGSVRGDIAWGGNWFFLTHEQPLDIEPGNVAALSEFAWQLRQAVNAAGFPEVDHVELFARGKMSGQHQLPVFKRCLQLDLRRIRFEFDDLGAGRQRLGRLGGRRRGEQTEGQRGNDISNRGGRNYIARSAQESAVV